MTGWECPKYGSCYGPFVVQCFTCGPRTETATTTGTIAIGPCGFYQPGNDSAASCRHCGRLQYEHGFAGMPQR
jgi:hypothetical protein